MDANMDALLAEFPSLARLDDGRVKCALTGHVMLAKPDVVQPYVKCAPGPGPPPPSSRWTAPVSAASESSFPTTASFSYRLLLRHRGALHFYLCRPGPGPGPLRAPTRTRQAKHNPTRRFSHA